MKNSAAGKNVFIRIWIVALCFSGLIYFTADMPQTTAAPAPTGATATSAMQSTSVSTATTTASVTKTTSYVQSLAPVSALSTITITSTSTNQSTSTSTATSVTRSLEEAAVLSALARSQSSDTSTDTSLEWIEVTDCPTSECPADTEIETSTSTDTATTVTFDPQEKLKYINEYNAALAKLEDKASSVTGGTKPPSGSKPGLIGLRPLKSKEERDAIQTVVTDFRTALEKILEWNAKCRAYKRKDQIIKISNDFWTAELACTASISMWDDNKYPHPPDN